MKLIDRINRGWLRGWRKSENPASGPFYALKQDVFCVDAQNVFDWLGSKDFTSLGQLCPIAKLPFEWMWFEYTIPNYGGIENFQFGIELWEPAPYQVRGIMFFRIPGQRHAGFVPVFLDVKTSDDWQPTRAEIAWIEDGRAGLSPAEADAESHDYYDLAITALAAVAFFHCKNVEIRKLHPSVRSSKSFAKKTGGVSLKTFGIIEVHKDMERTLRDGAKRAAHEITEAHIVRGHFKRFEADNKLFGRFEGMWFWEPHVRGGGIPVKRDYRVWAPNKKHVERCLVQAN